ncbi:MAG TPA: ankyrin repeat domain-containing protein [Micromonosporaceae bacterium]
MASASLPQDPSVDQLRRRARELQRAARNGDEAARRRVQQSHPDAPDAATLPLTGAQLVVAREHGFASWARLRRYVQIVTTRSWTPGQPPRDDEPVADRFLRLACLTYSDGNRADTEAAERLLDAHPQIVHENVMVAAACADVPAVRQHLTANPSAGTITGGPHGWSPLLYQAYARHNPSVGREATLETARALLAAGADPNDGRFWHALPTPFTVLTGVLGHGERNEASHVHAIPFARVLLDAGADPNDGQVLYNRMFGTNDDHLVLLFEYGLGTDTHGPWHRLLNESLDSPRVMLRKLLHWAVAHDQQARVALLAAHGVDVVTRFTDIGEGYTPVETALVNGHRELAEQLRRLGARPARLTVEDTFVADVLAGDAGATRLVPVGVVDHVRRTRTGLMTWAASQGAPNTIEVLASLGFDVNAYGRSDISSNDPWHTALHVAAQHGDVVLARTLLDLGADPRLRDKHYNGTPLGWARYFEQSALVEMLEPLTPEPPADSEDRRT